MFGHRQNNIINIFDLIHRQRLLGSGHSSNLSICPAQEVLDNRSHTIFFTFCYPSPLHLVQNSLPIPESLKRCYQNSNHQFQYF